MKHRRIVDIEQALREHQVLGTLLKEGCEPDYEWVEDKELSLLFYHVAEYDDSLKVLADASSLGAPFSVFWDDGALRIILTYDEL